MNLSRKNQRQIKRLRKDAAKLWAEQQAVNERAAELLGKAKHQAVVLGESELIPAVKSAYDANLRPGFEHGLAVARDAADDARIRFNGKVLPAAATLAGSIAGGLAALNKEHKELGLKDTAKTAKKTSKALEHHAKAAVKEYNRKTGKGGIGAGGWVAIGAGVAALAAIGYALWQTFRADDDLWIADEELDAPITTVKPADASRISEGDTVSDAQPKHLGGSAEDAIPSHSTIEHAEGEGIDVQKPVTDK
ncbi:hypothetical protein JRG19_09150 [Pseudoclavibacter alba]|uniref:DNA helicase n=1 Tax=Pseudoclavibacter albus TaxID=272241 RepID=A0ABT2HUV0_9MICO|nr:hypothetical protein [Pseudoclavibacter alba]MBN6778697.1 hypothetical protein [Pseudoclavibacter alba]MCT2042093.1 hypothetical protein [Pseudoclavibacter alba]